MQITHPVPIIEQAEAESVLPGMNKLIDKLDRAVYLARHKSAQAKVETWKIMRAIYEYAVHPATQEALESVNTLPNGNRRPGRPKQAHKLVMDKLEKKYSVSMRTLLRWQAEWTIVSERMEIAPGCSQKELGEAISRYDDPAKLIRAVETLTDLVVAEAPEEAAHLSPSGQEQYMKIKGLARTFHRAFETESGDLTVNPKLLHLFLEENRDIFDLHKVRLPKPQKQSDGI